MYHGDERLLVAYAHNPPHRRGREPDPFLEARAATEAETLRDLAAALRQLGPR